MNSGTPSREISVASSTHSIIKSALTEVNSPREIEASSAESKNCSDVTAGVWQPYLSLNRNARASIRRLEDWPVAKSDDLRRFEKLVKSKGIEACAMKVNTPTVSEQTAKFMNNARSGYPLLEFNPKIYLITIAAQINDKWHGLNVKTGITSLLADGKYIFVRMLTGELRVSDGVKNGANGHGVLAGYAWQVAASGNITVKNNQIEAYDIHSGTYQLSEELRHQAAMPENAKYIPLSEVEVKNKKIGETERKESRASENEAADTSATSAQSLSARQNLEHVPNQSPDSKSPALKDEPHADLKRGRSITTEQGLNLISTHEQKRERAIDENASNESQIANNNYKSSNGDPNNSSQEELSEHVGENAPVPEVINLDGRINS